MCTSFLVYFSCSLKYTVLDVGETLKEEHTGSSFHLSNIFLAVNISIDYINCLKMAELLCVNSQKGEKNNNKPCKHSGVKLKL